MTQQETPKHTNEFRPALARIDQMMMEYVSTNIASSMNGDIFIGQKLFKEYTYSEKAIEVDVKVKKIYKDDQGEIMLEIANFKNIGESSDYEVGKRETIKFSSLNIYQKLIIIDVLVDFLNQYETM